MKINSRSKGRAFEQFFVNWLKQFGYHATRSSYTNKHLDDVGKVDIETNHPINWQLKATEKVPAVHKILSEMDTTKPRAVAWKRNRKPILVIMELDEFLQLVEVQKDLLDEISNYEIEVKNLETRLKT